MIERHSDLHLPTPGLPPDQQRPRARRRRRPPRWRQAGIGLLMGIAGSGILLALMQLPERLDALLLVSGAIANLITGLSRLGLGVLQLAGVLGVVAMAGFSLLLVVGGLVRLFRALVPPS
jgi:hypothetical protein